MNIMFDKKIVWILLLALLLAACGGVPRINTAVPIPRLDRKIEYDTYYKAGWQALEEARPKLALMKFQQSAMTDELMYVAYGYTFLVQNKTGYAARNFRKALDLNPENMQAELGLAILYESAHDYEKAFTIYGRLSAVYPENTWIKTKYQEIKNAQTQYFLTKAEQFKNEKKTVKYIEALKAASRYSPGIIDIKIKIADYYRDQGDNNEAVRHYEKVLEEAPRKADVLLKLAHVYEQMEKVDAAIIIYKTLQEIKPGDLTIINKINELKIKFYESNLPAKFKEIFFKTAVNREDLAALLGFYFQKRLESGKSPVILRDIATSFAREYIILVCSAGIMDARPDHSFDRFPVIKRAYFAEVLDALLKYLRAKGYTVKIAPGEEALEPADISPQHKNYKTIKFLVNTRIMKLDPGGNFDATQDLSPGEAVASIKKILFSIE